MSVPFIRAEDVAGRLTWTAIADAIEAGHLGPRAELSDQFLHRGDDVMLSRAAWIDGRGIAVKTVSVLPGNAAKGRPTIHGAMLLFDDDTGEVRAVIDSALVTRLKTAGDSVLGARLLARPEATRILIIGAGTVAESLVEAYSEVFPGLTEFRIWNRTPARAEALVAKLSARYPVAISGPREEEAPRADIIACCTMSKEPVLFGDWVSPGTHVDLIGAFTADMREADDRLLQEGSLFVDSRETTIGHIGELMIPLASGAIAEKDVQGDFYDLCNGAMGRRNPDDITIFKNGGGAHLDLMVGQALVE